MRSPKSPPSRRLRLPQRTRSLPLKDWYRRNAGCTGRRIPWPDRNRDGWLWHGRRADIHWVQWESRVYAAPVFIGLQIFLNDVADEVGRNRCGWDVSSLTQDISPTGNISRARPMRWRHVSRPSTTRVSNSGGAYGPGHADRLEHLAGFQIRRARSQGGIQAIVAELRRFQNLAGLFENCQSHAPIALLRDQLIGVIRRQLFGKEKIRSGRDLAQMRSPRR